MNVFRKKPVTDIVNGCQLSRCLSAFDLVFLGIGAIIGAGIFVLTGIVAATLSGPSIMISYVLAGLACTFAALSYAELAASIGGCGSAYGYSYAGFGEVIAWIVGWDLLLEYSIAVAAVSVGWSGYFNDFLKTLYIQLPDYLLNPPALGGLFNILSTLVILFLMSLLILGVKSSARVNNFMVFVKLSVILIFIVLAVGNFNLDNWSPFMPFGFQGMVGGASLIFFAYIGFDAVSTAAEEALNPQRDLPLGILGSLLVCTIIYIIVAGLLTGIVPYTSLNVSSPISHAMLQLGHKFAAALIGVGAIAGLTTVMLVLFYGLSRVFLAMARDGLLPQFFSHINTRTKTPVRIILISGLTMAGISAMVPIHDLAELVNVGTLFAFMVVCIGVVVLRITHPELPRPFKTPLMPLIPILGVLSCFYLMINLPWVTLLRFLLWMLAGMILYFIHGRNNSVLNQPEEA